MLMIFSAVLLHEKVTHVYFQNEIRFAFRLGRLLYYFNESWSHLPHRRRWSWASQSAVLRPCPHADSLSLTLWSVCASFKLLALCTCHLRNLHAHNWPISIQDLYWAVRREQMCVRVKRTFHTHCINSVFSRLWKLWRVMGKTYVYLFVFQVISVNNVLV